MKNSKVIKGKPLEDKVGFYFGICTLERHPGIVRYSHMKQCERRRCENYVKYRPENYMEGKSF